MVIDLYLLGGSIDLIKSSQKIFGAWGPLLLSTTGPPKDPKSSNLGSRCTHGGGPQTPKKFLGALYQVKRPS